MMTMRIKKIMMMNEKTKIMMKKRITTVMMTMRMIEFTRRLLLRARVKHKPLTLNPTPRGKIDGKG
jgi:hypothetical protein